MKNLNFTIIGISILIVLNLVILSAMFFNRPGKHKFHGMRQGHEKTFMKHRNHPAHSKGDSKMQKRQHSPMGNLNLSEDQEKKVKQLRAEHRESIDELKGKIKDLRKKEMSMIKTGKIDPAQLNDLSTEFSSYQKELHHKKLQHFLAVSNLLTEEQKENFKMHRRPFNKMQHPASETQK